MRSFIRGGAVLLLVSGWACGDATAPSSATFSLSGQVTRSPTASGLSVATVSIADGANAGRSAMTNEMGHYLLTGLQPGTFTVMATNSGYVAASKSVMLTSDQVVDFTLAQSFAGRWTGTSTRAGDPARRLQLTVDDTNVLILVNASFATAACGGFGVDFAVASAMPISIANGSFVSTYTPQFNPSDTYLFTFTAATITGTFASASKASGTITVQDYVQSEPVGCASGTLVLTWTATKQ